MASVLVDRLLVGERVSAAVVLAMEVLLVEYSYTPPELSLEHLAGNMVQGRNRRVG